MSIVIAKPIEKAVNQEQKEEKAAKKGEKKEK